MEVGSEPHAPAALLLVPIQWEAPKPLWTFLLGEELNLLLLLGFEPRIVESNAL
jgi:hypothetical protein